jgi:hypothetical protein
VTKFIIFNLTDAARRDLIGRHAEHRILCPKNRL